MNFSCSASLRSRPRRSSSRRLLRHLHTLLQHHHSPNPNQTNKKKNTQTNKIKTQVEFFFQSINHLTLTLILIEIGLHRRRSRLPPLPRCRIAVVRGTHKIRSPAVFHLAGRVGTDERRRRRLLRGGGPVPIWKVGLWRTGAIVVCEGVFHVAEDVPAGIQSDGSPRCDSECGVGCLRRRREMEWDLSLVRRDGIGCGRRG